MERQSFWKDKHTQQHAVGQRTRLEWYLNWFRVFNLMTSLTYCYWCPSLSCTPAFLFYSLVLSRISRRFCRVLGADADQFSTLVLLIDLFLTAAPIFRWSKAFPSLSSADTLHAGSRETLLFDNPAYLYSMTRPHARDDRDYFFSYYSSCCFIMMGFFLFFMHLFCCWK